MRATHAARFASAALGLALAAASLLARAADDDNPLVCERNPRTGRPDCWPRVLVEAQRGTAKRAAAPIATALTMYVVFVQLPNARERDVFGADRARNAQMGISGSPSDLRDLERAVAQDRTAQWAPELVRDLAAIGLLLMHRGEYADAGRRLDEALAAAGRLRAPDLRGAILLNRGALQAVQGRYAEALASTQEALSLYRREDAAKPPPPAARDAAAIREILLRQIADVKTRNALLICHLHLASVHAQLGQFAEALRRLDDARPADAQEVVALRAAIALRAGQREQADALARRAAGAKPGLQNAIDHVGAFELQPPAAAAAGASAPAQRYESDVSVVDRTVPEVGLKTAEEAAQRAQTAGSPAEALAAWGRAALLAAHAGAADRLSAALAGQQRNARALGQRDLAIHYGKRAVEEIRRQRADLKGLDRNARRAFTETSRRVFEALADDLLTAGRLPEAERALLLLRQDDVADVVPPAAALPATAAELALRRHEASLQAGLTELDRRRSAAHALPANAVPVYEGVAEGLASDPARIEQVVDGYGQGLWPRPGTQIPKDDPMPDWIILEMLRRFAALQDCPDLPPQPQTAAARANARRLLERARAEGRDVPLPPPLEAMLAGRPDTRPPPPPLAIRFRCTVQEGARIEAEAASPPPALVAALAQRPVALTPDAESAVQAGRSALARTADGSVALHYLVLEGRLRILLVAAEGWTLRDVEASRAQVERAVAALEWATGAPGREATRPARELYAMLIEPIEADLQRVGARILVVAPDGPLRAVPLAALHDGRRWLIERYALASGAALAEGRAAPPPERLRLAAFGASAGGAGLVALPAVPAEVNGIVKVAGGRAWLDRAFTARALRDALAERYPVVHIASHFMLRDDDAGASFLLLGDGSQLTLREIGSEAYPMRGVDLVTLSACRTARDTRDSWGQAFEGLAAVLQRGGAASVLSTLWPVADASTAQLMTVFYRRRAGAGKAMALRSAQLELLRGGAGDADTTVRGVSRVYPEPMSEPAPEPALPWAHPFFWAPFVLAGEWR